MTYNLRMRVKVCGLTDTGLKRGNNQDSFLIDADAGLYIVADGMGGHRGGEVASAMATEVVQEVINRGNSDRRKPNPRELLLQAYQEASQRIYSRSQDDGGDLHGMGTTMVLAYVQDQKVYIGNVGDSRCYLFARPLMWQLTEDHSFINEQIRAGLISENDISEYMPKNIITRSVGYEQEVLPDFIERDLRPGESYLLCSDGLTGMVSDFEIAQILNDMPPQEAAQRCIEMAKENGGDDNITVMIVSVE